MILAIATRELRSMFLSPLAWSILAIVQFLIAYLFLGQLDIYLQLQPRLATLTDPPNLTESVVTPIFANAAVILLLATPLLTMRLISEERKSHTISLLFSSPVSMTEIILGKYLGIMGFIIVMLAFIGLMPLSILAGGELDLGLVAAGFVALFLLLASFAAAGLFMSSLTLQPTIAAISTFGILLLLWIVDWTLSLDNVNNENPLHYISMLKH